MFYLASHQGKWAVKMLVQVEDLSGAWTGVFSPRIASHAIHRSAADGGFMPAGRRLPLEAFIFSSPSRERWNRGTGEEVISLRVILPRQ